MSGVAIVNYLLGADATLIASVPVSSIKAGPLQQGVTLPAIALTTVGVVERKTIDPRSKMRLTERVQASILASTYTAAKALVPKVRKACRNKRSATGFTGVLVTVEEQGPDFGPNEIGVYMQTQDFLVTYDEAT